MRCCQIILKKIADKYGIEVGDAMKLKPNLGGKTNYVLHYRNIQLYFSLGMKLTTIHTVLTFKEPNWMKKYIDFNIEKRKNAANSLIDDQWQNNEKFTKKNQCQTTKQ